MRSNGLIWTGFMVVGVVAVAMFFYHKVVLGR